MGPLTQSQLSDSFASVGYKHCVPGHVVRRRFSYDIDLGSLPNSVVRAFYVVIIW